MRLDPWIIQSIRVARNALIDLRYGGLLLGKIKTRFAHLGAVNTENSDYAALSHIFENRIQSSDVLVDVGCGKGRVINWWLSRGLGNRMIGIELDERIAEQTRRRLRPYGNVTILTGHVVQNLPIDGTLFYLYNPFDAHVVDAFKNRLLTLFRERGNITILYYNCRHVEIFRNDPAWSVEVTDVGGASSLPFSRLAVIRMKSDGQRD